MLFSFKALFLPARGANNRFLRPGRVKSKELTAHAAGTEGARRLLWATLWLLNLGRMLPFPYTRPFRGSLSPLCHNPLLPPPSGPRYIWL